MKHRISTWKMLAIASLMTGVAVAQPPAGLDEKTFPTGYSGKSRGEPRVLSKSASERGAIFGLVMDEDSDDPCYLELEYLDVATGQKQPGKKFADCAGKGGEPRPPGARKQVELTGGRLATGVRVVLDKDREKLKGVQLFGTFAECRLGANEFTLAVSECSSVFGVAPYRRDTVEYRLCNTGDQPSSITVSCDDPRVASSPWFERTNAAGSNRGPDSDWEQTASCPEGMVATGMKLNLREGSGKRQMINGLALECRPLLR